MSPSCPGPTGIRSQRGRETATRDAVSNDRQPTLFRVTFHTFALARRSAPVKRLGTCEPTVKPGPFVNGMDRSTLGISSLADPGEPVRQTRPAAAQDRGRLCPRPCGAVASAVVGLLAAVSWAAFVDLTTRIGLNSRILAEMIMKSLD